MRAGVAATPAHKHMSLPRTKATAVPDCVQGARVLCFMIKAVSQTHWLAAADPWRGAGSAEETVMLPGVPGECSWARGVWARSSDHTACT